MSLFIYLLVITDKVSVIFSPSIISLIFTEFEGEESKRLQRPNSQKVSGGSVVLRFSTNIHHYIQYLSSWPLSMCSFLLLQLCCINLWTESLAALWFFTYVFTQMPSEDHLQLRDSGKEKLVEYFICISSLLYQGLAQAHSKQPPRPPAPARRSANFPELPVQHQWGNSTTTPADGEERRG